MLVGSRGQDTTTYTRIPRLLFPFFSKSVEEGAKRACYRLRNEPGTTAIRQNERRSFVFKADSVAVASVKLNGSFDYFIEQRVENPHLPTKAWHCTSRRHQTNNTVDEWNTIVGKRKPQIKNLIKALEQWSRKIHIIYSYTMLADTHVGVRFSRKR